MAMVRKQLYIKPATEKRLKAEAKLRGVPESVIIRERLEHRCSESPRVDDAAARKRFLKMLREMERRAKEYKGERSTWQFNREDAYEERIERQLPR
jgi:hypothetical protein